MGFSNLTRNELQEIHTQLEQALYNHLQWHNAVIRTLVCRIPSNIHDTKPKAYRDCLFGQWYYKYASKKINDHPGFLAIGESHRHMHNLVASLLHAIEYGGKIAPHEYDNFVNAMERMRLEVQSLKREIEISLYTHDPLTGAINRADMLPMLRDFYEMVKRQVMVCTVVMIDIDHFKKVNDQYGHGAGDKILAELARYISDRIRPYDKLFRYGGEEFLLCIPNTSLDDAHKRMETLRKGLATKVIEAGEGKPIHITASFGLAELTSDVLPEQCIERADKAMYAAKISGRNCAKIWNASMGG